jgi:hypothetical protein
VCYRQAHYDGLPFARHHRRRTLSRKAERACDDGGSIQILSYTVNKACEVPEEDAISGQGSEMCQTPGWIGRVGGRSVTNTHGEMRGIILASKC